MKTISILGTSHDNPLAKQLSEAKRRKTFINILSKQGLYDEYLKSGAQYTISFRQYKNKIFKLKMKNKKRKRKKKHGKKF